MSGKDRGVARFLSGATPASRLIAIGVACGALAIIPLPVLDRLPQLCLWERLFGWCPAHGTTHALAALLHGDVPRALSYNLNIVIIAPLLLAIAARDICLLLRHR
ncbi:MAG TPA: DUF2752 domain-containing protein [Anaerolineae bacterium]|nr:DUF2752 domain-containing protein [Anaerolineae bacterium]HOQ99331.1 DUF2752 domain-containing protein [Anaerolineae bacterium]HPL30424.1 DUF2752 domain-containing protein [Anaerolineae bacterium]